MDTFAIFRCLEHNCNISFLIEVFDETPDVDATCCPVCMSEDLYYVGDCALGLLELGGE